MFWRTTHDIVMEQVLIRRNDSLCFQAGNVISVQRKKKKKERKATVWAASFQSVFFGSCLWWTWGTRWWRTCSLNLNFKPGVDCCVVLSWGATRLCCLFVQVSPSPCYCHVWHVTLLSGIWTPLPATPALTPTKHKHDDHCSAAAWPYMCMVLFINMVVKD